MDAEASDHPLKQSLALLRYFNVFFLLNVDSYTRDDLMTLVAIKLSANVLRPGLFLEDTTLMVLRYFFMGLHVTPGFFNKLEDMTEKIVLCRRSGEWLLTDREYRNYLNSKKIKNDAEPLSEIAKSLTIALMELQRVEAALQSLAMLLVPIDENQRNPRGSFFEGLLELTNACARAALAENLENVFVEKVLHPWRPRAGFLANIRQSKQEQMTAISELQQTLADMRRSKPKPAAMSNTAHAIRAKDAALRNTFFLRLRVLCTFQLQLVNVSAYNETGRAIKLSAQLTDPKRTQENTSIYLLLCLHAGLNSLGYDLGVLHEVLHLFFPSKSSLPLLLIRNSSEMDEAKKLFFSMRALLQHVGKGTDTPKYAKHIQAHGGDDPFVHSCIEFLQRFPTPLHPRHKAPTPPCSSHARATDFDSLATAILQHEHRDPLSKDDIEKSLCAIENWFFQEEAAHAPWFAPVRGDDLTWV